MQPGYCTCSADPLCRSMTIQIYTVRYDKRVALSYNDNAYAESTRTKNDMNISSWTRLTPRFVTVQNMKSKPLTEPFHGGTKPMGAPLESIRVSMPAARRPVKHRDIVRLQAHNKHFLAVPSDLASSDRRCCLLAVAGGLAMKVCCFFTTCLWGFD